MKNPIGNILKWYFSRNSLPFWCVLIADCIIVLLSGIFSYWLSHRTAALIENHTPLLYTVIIYTVFSCISFRIFRTYSGVVRFSSFVDLMRVLYSTAIAACLALAYKLIVDHFGLDLPAVMWKSNILIMFLIATLFMWGERVLVKTLYEIAFSDKKAQRVLIFGALTGGIGLAKSIRSQRPRRFLLQGFISHDNRAKHMLLMGKKVHNVNENIAEVIEKERIQAVLVSPQRINDFRDNTQIQDVFIKAGCKIYFAQPAKEMDADNEQANEAISGEMHLKEVAVEDLLPRSEIVVDLDSVGQQLKDCNVLITGAAGSIGSEIVRQVAALRPAKLMLIDQAETPEHDIRLMMQKSFPDIPSETVVTSICNEERMDKIFSDFRPHYVFHAAAYKHVPMMEDNPSEAVRNNIIGTKIIADLAAKYGAAKFVMVSTDKAVNPTNVMGCSKRICEIYVQSLDKWLRSNSKKEETTTQYVTTRFGNVLGSNGSVIPLFREQIKNGGPVTVTDPNIVRFFMLIPEACKLVLEAGTKGNGGEIFVFDMGKPVRIADLAHRMIALSGAKNVKVEFTGLRAGEKLYEEVLNELEGTKPSFHEKIRIADVRKYDFEQVKKDIEELFEISKRFDNMATVKKMKQIVPEYKSNNSIYQTLD